MLRFGWRSFSLGEYVGLWVKILGLGGDVGVCCFEQKWVCV